MFDNYVTPEWTLDQLKTWEFHLSDYLAWSRTFKRADVPQIEAHLSVVQGRIREMEGTDMATTTDYTATARDIQVGWEVQDTESYGAILVEWVRHAGGVTYFAGTKARSGKPVVHAWHTNNPIVANGPLHTEVSATPTQTSEEANVTT